MIVESTIPIYKNQNPNPFTGKADCPLIRMKKERLRIQMRIELAELIKKYEQKSAESEGREEENEI